MKIIKYINTFAITLPFLITSTYPIIGETAIYFSLYSTMITGLIQVILGIILLINNPKNKFIQFYIVAVILFFTGWYFNQNINYLDFISFILLPIPLILATYLSILIYRRKQS